MKHIHYYILCVGLLLLSVLHVSAERIDTLLHFNLADLRIDTLTAPDGQTYTKLSYPECGEGFEVGCPVLPIKYFRFTLPDNAEEINCTIHATNEMRYVLEYKLYPVQKPESFSIKSKGFVPCDPSIYNVSENYPRKQAIITEVTNFYDECKKVIIAISPVIYKPMDNTICYTQDITFSLSYILPESRGPETKTSNPQSLYAMGLPVYDFCVITNRALKDAFNRLISWKRQKGIYAGVVCVEDIIENPYITQDDVSSSDYTPIQLLTDSAAQIRQYIRLANMNSTPSLYTNSPIIVKTHNVLLGGDYSVVPIRYGSGAINSGADEDLDNNIPTDLYYSDIGADWNKDNDKYLGEPGGNNHACEVNYFGRVLIGRLLCKTAEEVENYTDKLLWYEMNPGNGDYSYLKEALYVQADEGQLYEMGDSIASNMANVFPDYTVIQEAPSYNSLNPTSPTGGQVISVMSEPVGAVNFYAHGNPYEIFVRTMGANEDDYANSQDSIHFYAVTAKQGQRTYSRFESNNGFDKVENQHYPMIGFSASCYNAPFDIIQKMVCDENVLFDATSLGKSFTTGRDYGGPAWVGNTRVGLINMSLSVQTLMNNEIKTLKSMGEALALAKGNLMENTQGEKHYSALSVNLIGTPDLKLWTRLPSTFSPSQQLENYWQASVSYDGEIAHIGYRAIDDEAETEYYINLDNVNNPTQEFGIGSYSGIRVVTLYGDNLIPRILPLDIKNGDMYGSHYVFIKDATISGESNNQPVTFTDGSEYTFEKSGTFRMTKNVVIERGAKLVIKNSPINY